MLQEEKLGLQPGAALRELEQAILNQDPALGPPPRLPRRAPTRRRRRATIGALVAGGVAIAIVVAAAIATRNDPAPVVVPNSLVKIDAETNKIVDVIPVGRDPGQVRVVGVDAFVSSETDQTLTRVAADTGEVTTSGASGADRSLAAAGERFLWVTSLSQARVSRVAADSMQLVDGVLASARSGSRERGGRRGLAVGFLQPVARGGRPVRPAHSPRRASLPVRLRRRPGALRAHVRTGCRMGVPRLRQRAASNRRGLRRDAGSTRRCAAGRSHSGLRLGLGGGVRRRHRVANRPVVRDRFVDRQRRSRALRGCCRRRFRLGHEQL